MSIQPDERLQQLTTLLNQYRYSYVSEKELQDGMQSEDRKTEDIKSETIKTEERKEAISAKTAEQEVRSDV